MIRRREIYLPSDLVEQLWLVAKDTPAPSGKKFTADDIAELWLTQRMSAEPLVLDRQRRRREATEAADKQWREAHHITEPT